MAPGPSDEDVAAIESALQRVDHAEAVGAAIKFVGCVLRVGEHEALPLTADELQWDGCGADAARAPFEGAERVECVEDRLAGAGRLERHDLKQCGREPVQAGVAAHVAKAQQRPAPPQ